jgi:hypothetical protein
MYQTPLKIKKMSLIFNKSLQVNKIKLRLSKKKNKNLQMPKNKVKNSWYRLVFQIKRKSKKD